MASKHKKEGGWLPTGETEAITQILTFSNKMEIGRKRETGKSLRAQHAAKWEECSHARSLPVREEREREGEFEPGPTSPSIPQVSSP